MPDARQRFTGAKLMLFAGSRVIVLRRDRKPGLVWPGCLDFPGGGREEGETPEACALRETREELGLTVPSEALRLAHLRVAENGRHWFFAAHLQDRIVQDVRFGDEGTGWGAMEPEAFVADRLAIPHFRAILRAYLVRLAR
ncbi:NUDIX domain-containing protein [Primorskyibacter sp. 2E107]|uniref:NUDIX domain-containing protein n=1 Tax=Primorskyibacter sp. 2E107 TaxID=3403458 RepID=UPI003AF6C02E